MRALLVVALVSFVGIGTGARAQRDSARQVESPAPSEQSASAEHRTLISLDRAIGRLRENPLVPRLPDESAITQGNLTIEAGRTVTGPVAVYNGTLTIHGRVEGDVIALGGDVVVAAGGVVTGDAVAVEGAVRRTGGSVGGDARTLGGVLSRSADAPAARDEPRRVTSGVSLAISWLCVLLIIGIGVLVFAQPYLEGVVDTLETRFWRSFFVGLAGELALFPVLVLMIVGLAVTIIGVLLIPFAIVAYVLAIAGLVTLSFVAVARLTGGALGGDAVRRLSARGSALRGVIVGTVLLMGTWVAAAALASVPALGLSLRAIAATITFVGVTAGLGATILSRAGTRRAEAPAAKPPDPAVWQTPTPVTGVAAARRPAARKHEPV